MIVKKILRIDTDTGNLENFTLNASVVPVTTSGSVTNVTNTQDVITHVWSTGIIDGAAITLNHAEGTVDIGECDIVIRQGSDEDSPIVILHSYGATDIACASMDVTYIYHDWNNGTPQWGTTDSLSAISGTDKILAYAVSRSQSTLKAVSAVGTNVDMQRKLRQKDAECDGYVFSGFWRSRLAKSQISASNLAILIGAGKYFWFDNPITHTAFDTSIAGTEPANIFHYFYNRSSWQMLDNQKTINNSQYDLNGTLTTLSNNKYRCDWIYVVLNTEAASCVTVVMGNTEYGSLAEAQSSPQPATPPCMDGIAVLVGQAVIQKSASTMVVRHAGAYSFVGDPTTAGIHRELTGLTWSTGGHTGTANNAAGFDVDGNATDLSGTELTALLDEFSGTTKGLVPAASGSDAGYPLLASGDYGAIQAFVDGEDPTGWVDPNGITIEYNYTNRTVTLTGTLNYYYKGTKHTLTSPWTSSAHTATQGDWFLYSTDGTNFNWAQSPWNFTAVMVVKVTYGASEAASYGIRETHGLMPWQVHSVLHRQIGTYRLSGGAPTAGTYTENTASDAATTPGFDATFVVDEDLTTSIPLVTEGTYTTMYVGASSVPTFNVAATFPFISSGSYLQVNNASTGSMTNGINSRYYNIYQILIPATADSASQKYRMVFLQPQATYTSLASAQAEDPRNLSLGTLSSTATEFVYYTRITYVTASGDANTGKCRIATGGITYISGNKLTQTSGGGGSSGGGVSDHNLLTTLDWSSSGHTGTASNFAAFDSGGAATNLSATQVTAALNAFVGDSGSGGTKGLVPAPSAGDSAKYLKADGTWATVSSSGVSAGKAIALSMIFGG